MRIALISDIHGNQVALEAVLADIDLYEVGEIVCLGDIIGYGSDAAECLDLVRDRSSKILMGNHEVFTIFPINSRDLGGAAGRGIEHAREVLSEEQLDWIARRPMTEEVAGATLVHASLNDPGEFYHVLKLRHAKKHFQHQDAPLCFNGHTHNPIIFEKGENWIESCKPPDGFISLNPLSKYLINVGSVGQPRDDNPSACYVIFDTDKYAISFERVEYDVRKAQKRFEDAKMHPSVIKRIAKGH